ncbi:uncharacterized protein LOC134766400 [Penaeus indicus]|uniref:uncharacterized protein LOC134766400 n=1 Tax=Penaeus indicus TaxID=29960 RepID=UPI00300C9D3F
MFSVQEHQGVDPAFIKIIRDLYYGATSTLKLHKDSDKITLQRGARPRLFTACLQDAILGHTEWDECGINIDGEQLVHLDFADDILMAHSPQELEKLLNDINNNSKPVGLNMHLGKIKVMFNKHIAPKDISVNGTTIERVNKYVYLGRTITESGDLLPKIKRRITLGWAAFGKVDNIMRSKKASMKLKKNALNEYIRNAGGRSAKKWINPTITNHTDRAEHNMAITAAKLAINRKYNIVLRMAILVIYSCKSSIIPKSILVNNLTLQERWQSTAAESYRRVAVFTTASCTTQLYSVAQGSQAIHKSVVDMICFVNYDRSLEGLLY